MKKQLLKKHTHQKRGFTLVEMMVAIFIFSIVMTIATGAIFSVVNANKTAQSLKSVMDNLNSTLDDMSRNIRYGSTYHCQAGSTNIGTDEAGIDQEQSCGQGVGSTWMTYESKGGSTTTAADQISYVFDQVGHAIDRCVGLGFATTTAPGITPNCIQLTAPEVQVQDLHFYVTGASSAENTQPMVLITLHGFAQNGNSSSTFAIETIASQRNPDCKLAYNGVCP